jgi:Fe-S cluster assembly protein SufD
MMLEAPFLFSLKPSLEKEGLVATFQKRAWERFLQFGLPTGKEEQFRSLPLRALYQREVIGEPFAPLQLPTLPAKALFLSIEDAALRFPFVVKDRLEKFLNEEKNPFALLSFALHRGGGFLYLPPGTTLEKPIECSLPPFTYLLVALGRGSKASLSLHHAPSDLSFGLIDLGLDNGSKLHLTETEEGNEESFAFQAIRGDLKRDAHLEGLHLSKGGKMAFSHKRIDLSGENAEADLSGLWSLKGAHTAQMWIEMIHKEPNARSRQRFKGVLYDSAISTFFGEIFVHDKAQGTDAYQLNQNLLLGENAKAEARPNLQIFADDVKASHGATIGGLQPDELFYLKARGLSETTARELLIDAFLNDIISLHPETARRKEMATWMQN